MISFNVKRLRLTKQKLYLVLFATTLSLLSWHYLNISLPVAIVEANGTRQDVFAADACEEVFGKCDKDEAGNAIPGGFNVVQAIQSGRIAITGLTQSQVLRSLYETYTEAKARNLCTTEDYSIFPLLIEMGGSDRNYDYDSNRSKLLNKVVGGDAYDIAGGGSLVTVANACPPGWNAQQAPRALTGWTPGFGCCPTGFSFINQKEQASTIDYTIGACCKITGSPSDYYFHKSYGADPRTTGCYSNTDIAVATTQTSTYRSATTEEEVFERLEAGDLIYQLRGMTGSLSYLNDFRPQLGLQLGTDFAANYTPAGNNRLIYGFDPIGAQMNCENTNGCALINETSGATLEVDNNVFDANPGQTFGIRPSSELNLAGSAGLTCQSCYAPGAPITLEKSSTGVTQLVRCAPGNVSGGYVTRTNLINNSVGDTLASLNTSGDENKDLIADCRSKGGVPWALGCIDPTPLGVITGLIRIALGTVGGIALIRFLIIGISLMRGDETQIKDNREKLMSTLIGVAVLVFSVLILRILGINILDVIPTGTV